MKKTLLALALTFLTLTAKAAVVDCAQNTCINQNPAGASSSNVINYQWPVAAQPVNTNCTGGTQTIYIYKDTPAIYNIGLKQLTIPVVKIEGQSEQYKKVVLQFGASPSEPNVLSIGE